MSALFGIIGLYDAQKATRAYSRISHRDSDISMTCQSENHFFIHQMPVYCKSEDILVGVDGRIENITELCILLELESACEAEIVVAAYTKWGVESISYLRGAFAIAILDGGTLHIFRDRFGAKPLFYLHTSEAFYFASEIKALLPFLDRVELNQDALMSYLSF